MNLIWACQIGGLVIMVGLTVWWVLERRKLLLKMRVDDRVKACLNVLESRAMQQELEWGQFKEEMGIQLKSLKGICNEAQKILNKSGNVFGNAVPSMEECELRALVNQSSNRDHCSEIPTINELQKTNNRLKSEASFELRTLLNEQLA